MAILSRGFDQTNLKGSVGAVTYRRVEGVTIASQKVPMHVIAKQTRALMRVRMRWANLVALWQSLNVAGWHPSFIKEARQSDYNRFMSVNMSGSTPVYLTKSVKAYGGGVVAPVVITEGSLHPVSVEIVSNQATSDIVMGTLTLGTSTTLKAFSDAIVGNNTDWQHGDKLTIVIMRQTTADGVPMAKSSVYTVTLDTRDSAATVMLNDILDVAALVISDGVLGLSSPVTGGVAFVHSRIVDGETVCSRQSIVTNNTTTLTAYTGETAFTTAVDSFGGFAAEETLTPDLDGQTAGTDVNP